MLEIIPNTLDLDESALFGFLDKEELARHLSLFFSGQGQCASLPDARIRVLKWHKKSRCTMEITLETVGVFHELIAKIYAATGTRSSKPLSGLRIGWCTFIIWLHV